MPLKANLIFNPAAGNPVESAAQLVELLKQLQAVDIQAEVLLVQPEYRLADIARRAARAGSRLMIASGGDGTIENIALGLVGTQTLLGIVPTGTRNNLARSLDIPTNDIPAAVTLLRRGRRLKIDVGLVRQGETRRYFLEASALGLASALYPAADDIQHGDLGKIAEFISTFVSHTPSKLRLRLNRQRRALETEAHMVLVANTPYIGANFQIAPDVTFQDGLLDVFVYSHLSKLDLIGHAIQLTTGTTDDRVQRFRVSSIAIAADPPMSVMADGVLLGEGPVTVTVEPQGLSVMAGTTAGAKSSQARDKAAQVAEPAPNPSTPVGNPP